MRCPNCQSNIVIRYGFFTRRARHRVQRYKCKSCRNLFSEQSFQLSYRSRMDGLDQVLFRLLCSGVSQRRCAKIFGIDPRTVARRMVNMGKFSAVELHEMRQKIDKVSEITFDEMETFEHTKCKPLSIAVAVDHKTRRILSVVSSQMPAKGKLAKISRKKYGPRPDQRKPALNIVMTQLKQVATQEDRLLLRSDLCPRYPPLVRRHFPLATYHRFKGRRGCVVGQGELKRGGFDPLFPLNHTCAVNRDNLKRLSRRTWCTTKRSDRLQALLNIHACYHNQSIAGELPRCRTTIKGISFCVFDL